MRVGILILIVTLGSLMLTACGVGAGSGTEDIREIRVKASTFEFEPSSISVKVGDRIRLVAESTDVFHTFTVDELGIDISLWEEDPEVVEEFVAEKSGIFELYCRPHRSVGMVGSFEVTS